MSEDFRNFMNESNRLEGIAQNLERNPAQLRAYVRHHETLPSVPVSNGKKVAVKHLNGEQR